MRCVVPALVLACAGCNSILGIEDLTLVDGMIEPDGPPTTFVFRQGVGGYLGTQDTFISPANGGNDVHGDEASLSWDDDDDKHALIQFTDIFGSEPGKIPIGATIQSAELQLTITEMGAMAGQLYEITAAAAWTEATPFTMFGPVPGVQSQDRALQVGVISASAVGTVTVSVTTTLDRWSRDEIPNHGWVISPQDDNDVGAASSEATDETTRPQLTVEIAP